MRRTSDNISVMHGEFSSLGFSETEIDEYLVLLI